MSNNTRITDEAIRKRMNNGTRPRVGCQSMEVIKEMETVLQKFSDQKPNDIESIESIESIAPAQPTIQLQTMVSSCLKHKDIRPEGSQKQKNEDKKINFSTYFKDSKSSKTNKSTQITENGKNTKKENDQDENQNVKSKRIANKSSTINKKGMPDNKISSRNIKTISCYDFPRKFKKLQRLIPDVMFNNKITIKNVIRELESSLYFSLRNFDGECDNTYLSTFVMVDLRSFFNQLREQNDKLIVTYYTVRKENKDDNIYLCQTSYYKKHRNKQIILDYRLSKYILLIICIYYIRRDIPSISKS